MKIRPPHSSRPAKKRGRYPFYFDPRELVGKRNGPFAYLDRVMAYGGVRVILYGHIRRKAYWIGTPEGNIKEIPE